MDTYYPTRMLSSRRSPARTSATGFERDLEALLRALGIVRGRDSGRLELPRCEAGRNRTGNARPDLRLVSGAIKDFIDAHADEAIDLDRIAAAVGLSKYHLIRLFHEAEGTTPWAYVRDARLRKAKELLETDLPLAEVALRSGFYDQSHFTRTFRESEGETPGRYRRRKIIQDRAAIHP